MSAHLEHDCGAPRQLEVLVCGDARRERIAGCSQLGGLAPRLLSFHRIRLLSNAAIAAMQSRSACRRRRCVRDYPGRSRHRRAGYILLLARTVVRAAAQPLLLLERRRQPCSAGWRRGSANSGTASNVAEASAGAGLRTQ